MSKKIVRADLAEDLYNSYSDKFGREEAARIIDHIILKMKNGFQGLCQEHIKTGQVRLIC